MPTLPDVREPIFARLAERLPTRPGWSYEIKWDGYRCLALLSGQTAASTMQCQTIAAGKAKDTTESVGCW